MRNFAIHFEHPWLLLLLIPAFALTLILYLMINKRFRRTRNRVISVVLHSIVMVLCIFVLAGITFQYDVTNLENEIILLVDVSETETQSAQRRDEFVQNVITESSYDGYKVGIVTFGFDQKYAVPLTHQTDSIYDAYLRAELPDTSATDIASALRYISEQQLFQNPETAKIVLISDGKETDEDATSVIGAIAKQGITVDTVYISSEFKEDTVQVMGLQYPDYHVNLNEPFTLTVQLQCRLSSPSTTVQVYDNGTSAAGMAQTVDLGVGEQTVSFQMSFTTLGLHEITVKISNDADGFVSNNDFSSYYYLEVFNRILIIEHQDESANLKAMLEANEAYADTVDVLNLSSYESLPETAEALRGYDQIILNNISNADLRDLPVPESIGEENGKDWFVKNLYSYVYEYGGGLFTVGGKDGDGATAKAHAYNHEDLYNTLFQDMLPVRAIDYTPPVAVMIILDISGSMGSGEEGTPLYYAKEGAFACLDVLTERDYVGIMTLDTNYGVIMNLTPATERDRIREAIRNIGTGSSTVYSDAIKSAGERLRQQENVDKRHIVIVSDGYPGEEPDDYIPIARDLHDRSGITLSFVGVGVSEGDDEYKNMSDLVEAGGGEMHVAPNNDYRTIMDEMRADLNAPQIKEVSYEPFSPLVMDTLSPLFSGVEYGDPSGTGNRRQMNVELNGFFGTKARESAEVLLAGDYGVPIYAQWKYGKGMVGSFLCDLEGGTGSWSQAFMQDASGRQFLYNVVANLMPTENLRPGEIRLELSEENYINRLSVFTTLEEGQRIVGRIIETSNAEESTQSYSLNEAPETPDAQVYVTDFLSGENRYSRCNFVVKKSGVYKIVIEKYTGDALQASVTIYKSFAYSDEYDSFIEAEPEEGQNMLAQLADSGNGTVVEEDNYWSIFESFVTSLHRSYDPRLAFLIIAMVLFLGDIAVRKFKFKWIHELVREHRAKKAETR